MKRRTFLAWTAALLGGAAAGGGLLTALMRRPKPEVDVANWSGLTAADVTLVNAMANVVIPPTQTPGAGDVNVGQVIAGIVANCYSPRDQAALVEGLHDLNRDCLRKHGATFVDVGLEAKMDMIRSLDREQRFQARLQEVVRRGKSLVGSKLGSMVGGLVVDDSGPHYFEQLKGLIVVCYCHSEPGATQTLRYEAVPGSYNGALPYRKGDRAWAT